MVRESQKKIGEERLTEKAKLRLKLELRSANFEFPLENQIFPFLHFYENPQLRKAFFSDWMFAEFEKKYFLDLTREFNFKI